MINYSPNHKTRPFINSIAAIILLLVASNYSYSQNSIIKVYASNDLGHTDTLIFGLLEDSQIGLDAQLGEVNYYGQPTDSLDIRIRQRDSLNFSCGTIESLDEIVYWENNLDLKTDFRPYEGFDGFENNTFEVHVSSNSYPVHLTFDISEIGFMDSNVLRTSKNEMCEEYVIYGVFVNTPQTNHMSSVDFETILFFSFESFDTVYYLVNNNNVENPNFKYYPNPAANFLCIESDVNLLVSIFDLSGKLMLEEKLNQVGKHILDIEKVPAGVYILKVFEQKSNTFTNKKLVKH